VGTDTNWASVHTIATHTIARKTDGSIWTCGLRSFGRGGVEIIASISSPVQVQSATNWKIPSSSSSVSAAIKVFTTQNPTT
jgi:alpha-tubulin suppressor-like RCC1 family protein